MTLTSDSNSSATLSGRELALKRRQAMAKNGKTAIAKTMGAMSVRQDASSCAGVAPKARPAAVITAAPNAAQLMAQTQTTVAATSSTARQASRARRETLSTVGKAALKQASARPSGRVRPAQRSLIQEASAPVSTDVVASCGCGCNGANKSCATSDKRETAAYESGLVSAVYTPAVDSAPRKADVPTGRALARARRAALAQDGKAGLRRVAQATKIAATMPQQDWQAAISKGATGRQVSMQRRLAQSLVGRLEVAKQATRPTGRVRTRVARNESAPVPVKVETGHTLSGQTVTGTMVERSKVVTGNEPGSCRTITGTEYIGSEQFDALCSARPAPAPAKVGLSSTVRERRVTGTEVGRSQQVTGDEIGACKGITGTEYLAAQHYDEFCNTRPAPAPAKIASTESSKGKLITGTLVNRPADVTGGEQGADRSVTGTGYNMSTTVASAPDKVALTHTARGAAVTGTSVGQSEKITGDETGSCRGITGTEYLAREQYIAICNTEAPATPRKVSVMSSRGNMPVSGSEVGRSEKVTGDEPGSCRSITGSQYYTTPGNSALCEAPAPRKVSTMQTLSGRTLTGTEVGRSPKVTGDEMGGCTSVTGTEYIGANQQQAVCAVSTPVAPVAKVAVDQTWRGQAVTGTYVGRSTKVTGDEFGGCAPISGTPYIGRNQYSSFCESPALLEQEARIRASALMSALPVTGDRPGAGGSVMTGDERGACGTVSGTPYVGIDNSQSSCAPSGRYVPRQQAWVEPPRPAAPLDFSISTPARAAQQRNNDVTGMTSSNERITGPVNKAGGLITGTPEFRHRETAPLTANQETALPAATRLTGDGNQNGRPVTGDAWSALSRVSGTEGASSQMRNPTERGNPRGMGMNALRFRDTVEAPEIPDSRVTGSSGNTGKGAFVTLSGGARG